tara:strand:- start:291 stop:1610 length:1320 start_codon:yes stop_codon:yes gene_type:complete
MGMSKKETSQGITGKINTKQQEIRSLEKKLGQIEAQEHIDDIYEYILDIYKKQRDWYNKFRFTLSIIFNTALNQQPKRGANYTLKKTKGGRAIAKAYGYMTRKNALKLLQLSVVITLLVSFTVSGVPFPYMVLSGEATATGATYSGAFGHGVDLLFGVLGMGTAASGAYNIMEGGKIKTDISVYMKQLTQLHQDNKELDKLRKFVRKQGMDRKIIAERQWANLQTGDIENGLRDYRNMLIKNEEIDKIMRNNASKIVQQKKATDEFKQGFKALTGDELGESDTDDIDKLISAIKDKIPINGKRFTHTALTVYLLIHETLLEFPIPDFSGIKHDENDGWKEIKLKYTATDLLKYNFMDNKFFKRFGDFVEKINTLSGVNDQESAGSDSATSPSEEETITDVSDPGLGKLFEGGQRGQKNKNKTKRRNRNKKNKTKRRNRK